MAKSASLVSPLPQIFLATTDGHRVAEIDFRQQDLPALALLIRTTSLNIFRGIRQLHTSPSAILPDDGPGFAGESSSRRGFRESTNLFFAEMTTVQPKRRQNAHRSAIICFSPTTLLPLLLGPPVEISRADGGAATDVSNAGMNGYNHSSEVKGQFDNLQTLLGEITNPKI